jgi:heme exporter protein A
VDETVPAVVLEGVAKRFGHLTALRGVDLQVKEGDSLTLFGPNGAGKSTLLRLIATLGKPSSGRVLIRGADTQLEPERVRSSIGLISHQTLLYEDLTAAENLIFYGRLYGLTDLNERVQGSLKAVGLDGREDDRVRGFSRGMKQRLAIARSTLHDPAILLLDEPFTGLDASARTMLSDLLQGLREAGRTVVLVTHDLFRGLTLSDRFVILNRGRITKRGESEGLTAEEFESVYADATQN